MVEPVKGAKFPLYLIDEEWKLLIYAVIDYAYSSDSEIVQIHLIQENLKEQLEKLGVKA